jgi:hypothetical protein
MVLMGLVFFQDPMWTAWSNWEKCSLSCGLGKKRKTRQCQDLVTRMPMKGGIDCIGGSYDLMEDCKIRDCPSKFLPS